MRRIDLHVHTTASDGTCTPTEVVEQAARLGLAAIAITDHDCALGYAEAAEAGQRLGVEIIPGIELSTKYNGSVHVLGYFIDADSPAIAPALEWIVSDREDRNRKIAELMVADGIPIDFEEMKQRFGEVMGRPHFARMLVELGYAESIPDAFARYVNRGQKYYIPREFITIEKSIQMICKAGGLPVLAHPLHYAGDDDGMRAMISHCMEYGLQGIECRYTGYTPEAMAYLEGLADDFGLLKTGGSDFHGANKTHIFMGSGTAEGELCVPYEFLEKLKDAKKRLSV